MSKRLRASLASKRGRMLRPRSERASSAGVATDSAESQENFEDDRGSMAPADEAAEGHASEIPESALDTPAPAPVQAAAEEIVPAPSPAAEVGEPVGVAAVAAAPEEIVPAPVETAELKSEPSNLETASAAAAEPEPVQDEPAREAVEAAPARALVTEPDAPVQARAPEPSASGASQESDGKKKKKKKKSDKSARAEAPRAIEAAPAPKAEVEKAAEPAAKDVAEEPLRETSSTPLAFAGEDDHDLSISNHHFFSSPQVDDHAAAIEDDQPKYIPPTKEELARQTRLKRIVGGVVGVAALVAVIGVGKMVLGSKPADAMPTSTPPSNAAKTAPAKTDEAKVTEPTVTATQAAPLATPAPSTDTSAAPADASAAPSGSASADAPPSGELKSPEEIKKLEIRCAQLGNGTDMKKAVETCREAIAAGGTNAMTYMYIYNSLITLGKGGEAREALNDCVTNATTGNKGECAQWGGKKKP